MTPSQRPVGRVWVEPMRDYLVMALVAVLAVMAAKALFPKIPVLSNFAHLI